MVYHLAKAFWLIAQPGNLLVLLTILGAVLLLTRWQRLGRWLVLATACVLLTIAAMPVGDWALQPLENRFPRLTELPRRVDGIIMLGGAVDTLITYERGEPNMGDETERLIAFADLARRYPQAKLVATGGGLSLDGGRFREADATREALEWLGTDTTQIIFERASRNTFENVVDSKAIAHPKPGETWILITSAYHMPRSVGLFRAEDWPVIPDPVDYRTSGKAQIDANIDLTASLKLLSIAAKEWTGMLANRILGRSRCLFPGPRG